MLDVKDHMTPDLLVGDRDLFAILRNPESSSDICHLFLNCISPEGVPIPFIDFIGLLDCAWNFNTKLELPLQVPRLSALYKLDDPLSLPQDKGHPPVKSRFGVDTLRDRIFSHLQWV